LKDFNSKSVLSLKILIIILVKYISSELIINRLSEILFCNVITASLNCSTFDIVIMKKLNFKTYNFKIKNKDNKSYIFDIVRKKYIILTKEEWVRQNTVFYLINELKIPLSHINVEKEFIINNLKKRFDIVVYSKTGHCSILVECKSFNIKLNEKAIDQILIYNKFLKSSYLMITNGINHLFLKNLNEKVDVINHLPVYLDL